jgi:hypothetical protein
VCVCTCVRRFTMLVVSAVVISSVQMLPHSSTRATCTTDINVALRAGVLQGTLQRTLVVESSKVSDSEVGSRELCVVRWATVVRRRRMTRSEGVSNHDPKRTKHDCHHKHCFVNITAIAQRLHD